ncbi:IclR family transcriptional regulator [Jatrophihabitans sp. DSM 45814]
MDALPEHESSADEQAGGHRGVERIARILEAAAANPAGVRLIDAATMLDAPRSSIHSLLKGLTWVGYLEEREGRYVIGRGLQALLAPHQTSWLVDLASDAVIQLSREVGETALLGVHTGDSIVYIFQAESNQSIHYTAKIGERRPIYPTSIGKLFLADMDHRSLDAFFRVHAKLNRPRVTKELERIRREGIAYNREETVKGVTAAAAAIHAPDGSTLAAISVVGPVYRMTDELPHIAQKVSVLATKLTKLVRSSPYARPGQ